MLAKGDTCVFQRTKDASYVFGVVEDVDDQDRVLITAPGSNADSFWVKSSRVQNLKSAKGDVIAQCLDSLNESYIHMQLEAAKLLKDNARDLVSHQTIPYTGSPYEEGEDLCERMDQLSTSDGNQGRVECSEEQVKSSPRKWQVGDICVCRWSEDNKWYFAEIIDVADSAGYCDVRFLYYDNEQYFVRLDRIHRVDASTWKWVEAGDNASVAQRLLTRRQPQASVPVSDPEEKRAARLKNPNVGDICVCQWGGDAYFYFVKVVAMDIAEQMYKVKLLHYKRRQFYVTFENIYPYYSIEANMVTYGRNVNRMRTEIVKQMSLPKAVPEASEQYGEPNAKDRKGRGKKRSRRGEWRTSGGMVLSNFWRTLLLETYDNDEKAVRNLLNSWYMCGYQTGYAMAHKFGKSEGA